MPNLVEVTIRVNDDTGAAFASVTARAKALKASLGDIGSIHLGVDVSGLDSTLMALRAKIRALGIADIADVNVQPGQITAQLQLLKRLISQEGISDLLDVNLNEAQLADKLGALKGLTETIPINFDVSKLDLAKTLAAETVPVKLDAPESIPNLGSGQTITDKVTVDGIVAAETEIAALNGQLDGLRTKAETTATGVTTLGAATKSAGSDVSNVNIISGNWFRTLTNIGSTAVPLFSGALGQLIPALHDSDSGIVKLAGHLVNTTNGWHLMTEAVVETLAIWGPASIAAVAFGLAAYPAVMKITQQLTNMNTAAKGTGQAFQSLASSGESVTAAVKPSVLEAFGIGLDAIHTSSGTLAPDLAKLGSAFDQLAAKAAAAFESKASGTFMTQASDDLLKLIDSFSQVGSILGTLMKAVPGYAEILLNFGDAGLHAGASVVAGIEPVLAAFLKLHGAILYGGLTGSASAWVFAKIVDAASGAALGVATAATKILGEENIITKGALGFGGAIEDLSAGPVIAGVGLLAGAFAAVVLYLKASKTQADNFNSSIQGLISSSTLAQLHTTIAGAMTQTSAQYVSALGKMESAETALHQPASANVADAERMASEARGAGSALETAAEAAGTYKAGLDQVSSQQTNFNDNLNEVAKTLGVSVPSALAILEGAQVTASQATSKNAGNTQQLNIEARGYLTTLGVMTAGTGSLNQALNALNVTQSTQVTDAQKLTQAYTGWIGIVTGGDSAFTSFEQGQATLSDTLSTANAGAVKMTDTSGKLKEQISLVGASMNGTSAASLAARQAFDSQITSAVTLYGNLQTMAAVSGNTATAQVALTKAGRDLVAQLLPLANGSQTATAEVYALAQIAGYSGVDSFSALSKWLGTTKGAESDLNDQTTILTVSSANLTQAAKNLSAAVGQEITDAEAQAIAKTDGFQTATDNLAQAINKSQGTASAAAVTYAGQMYESLIKAGDGSTDAKNQVDAFLKQLGATPATVATVNAALAKLPKTTTLGVNVVGSGSGTITFAEQDIKNAATGLLEFHAAGGPIGGSGGPTQDNIPVWASKGEFMMQTASVNKYGLPFMEAVNAGKLAGGGLVDTAQFGNGVNWMGAAMTSAAKSAEGSAAALMIADMKAKVAAAAAAAALAGSPVPFSGIAGITQWEPDVAQVLSMLGLPQADLPTVMSQMGTESGGNPNAINLTDSNAAAGDPSRGLMQVIGTTFAAYRNPSLSSNIYDPEANIYAGVNYAVHEYGNPGWLSVLGHGHGYASGGATSAGWATLGEQGRELVKLPGGAHVYPAGQTAQMVAGGSGGQVAVSFDLGSSSGGTSFDDLMLAWIREKARIKGGGNVQTAFGRNK